MTTEKESVLNNMLWNLAGYKKDIIRLCKVDAYHATIIGVLLLMVGIYAAAAWTFFFQSVFENDWLALVCGLFMGAFIVSFDRALIASMSSGKVNIASLVFRFFLAVLLGIFLSQPMILKLYEPEVLRESQILVDQKILERKKELEKLYASEINSLTIRKKEFEQKIDSQKKIRDGSEADLKKEMDGSGGTGQRGYAAISKKKEVLFLDHVDRYRELEKTYLPKIDTLQAKIEKIRDTITKQTDVFRKSTTKFGTLIQAEALESLIQKDKTKTLRNRYYLLAVILTLIELSALLAKLIFNSNSYNAQTAAISDEEIKISSDNREITWSKLNRNKEHALENEMNQVNDFFEKSKDVNTQKLDELIDDWKNSKEATYTDFWKRFKEKFIIRDK